MEVVTPYSSKLTEVEIATLNREYQNRTEAKAILEHGVDPETLERYADQIDEILERSPIDVAYFDGTYYLIDGHHRVDAYQLAYPEALTVPARVQVLETIEAVKLHSIRANFQHGRHLSPGEQKLNVRELAGQLNYQGFSDKEFIDQLRIFTKIDRATLNRYTRRERDCIDRKLYRAVAEKRLAGCSVRATADELNLPSKSAVERIEERRKESLIYPLPDDPWTMAAAIDVMTRIFVPEQDAYDWLYDLEVDDEGNYVIDGQEGVDWFYDPDETDVIRVPFDRVERMESSLRDMHESWCESSTLGWPYPLACFSFEDVKAALIPRADMLCLMSDEERDKYLPDEQGLDGDDKSQRDAFLGSDLKCIVRRYRQDRSNAFIGLENWSDGLEDGSDQSSTQIDQCSSDLFDIEDLSECSPADNPAELVAKEEAGRHLDALIRSMKGLVHCVKDRGTSPEELKKHLSAPELADVRKLLSDLQ